MLVANLIGYLNLNVTPHRLDVTHFKLFKNETYGKVKVADIFSYADAYDICCGRNTHKTAEFNAIKKMTPGMLVY